MEAMPMASFSIAPAQNALKTTKDIIGIGGA